MKKIKKIMAMLLAMVMVLGMTVTASAANVTITVNDENGEKLNDAELKYVQVIKPDRTTRTGWTFIEDAYANAYIAAFKLTGQDDAAQKVIDKLIADDGKSSEVADALSKIAAMDDKLTIMQNPQTVTSAGVYVIKATQENFTYNNMAAYVGFGPVESANYPELTSVELTAKRTPTTVGKEVADEDKVVAIGDILTYTIKTTVPYIDPNHTDRTFKITDTITGAVYYLTGEGSKATVQMGNDTVVGGEELFDVVDNSFDIDLSELILDNNANAGKEIVITYTAKVTQVDINNQAGSHISGTETSSKPDVDVYTGEITLTKFDADNNDKKLAGAGFKVTKEGNDKVLKFTKNEDGVYTYNPEGDVEEVFTGTNGTLVLKGLDLGTYNFKETTAPEGYHIADTEGGIDTSAILKLEEGETTATATIKASAELANTKLSSLPSTGGIGTTIFTIGGCAIMVAAAGLFFASRRKANK